MAEVIQITGAEALLHVLGMPLDRTLQHVAEDVADEGQKRLEDYPAEPTPADPDRWYERGYGPRWRRPDGTIGGQETSEHLGASWTVKPRPWGAVLENRASYAAVVQGADQSAQHADTGWLTDEQFAADVEHEHLPEHLVEQQLRRELDA